MRATFVEVLTELSRQDDKVMCVIGDTGFSVFEEYEKEFKERFVNVGIAEQNFVSFGAGLAAMGMKPFIYNVASFMCYRAFEQIELDVCYQENPVVLVGVGGGHAYGTGGPTHHAYFDIALMTQLPNMTVLVPADPVEMRACMKAAYELQRPVYIRIGRSVDPVIHTEEIDFRIGNAIPIADGADGVILATGTMVKDAIQVVKKLEEKGKSFSLYSVPSIKPMDDELIKELGQKYNRIYTVEEHSVKGGLADAVRSSLAQAELQHVRIVPFGFADTFAPVTGSREYLNGVYGMSVESMTEAICQCERV